jgi:hypothetical protein
MEVRMLAENDGVDTNGLAHAGSQRSLQLWVNRRGDDLSESIRDALRHELPSSSVIRWVSPLASKRYAEYHDTDFLRAVGYDRLSARLASFWPKGGPHWDALAVVEDPCLNGASGVILLEAKSYAREMYSGGCAASPASRRHIEESLGVIKGWLGAATGADWTGPLYQHANRLAHLYFLREIAGVPTWLINVCFVNDRRSPTGRDGWLIALAQARQELGLVGQAPHEADLILDAMNE